MSPDDPRHGTYAGSQQHWKDGEKACDPCAVARREYAREYVSEWRRRTGRTKRMLVPVAVPGQVSGLGWPG